MTQSEGRRKDDWDELAQQEYAMDKAKREFEQGVGGLHNNSVIDNREFCDLQIS